MSDELKRLEIELAKVRLAKEQLELHDALKRAQRKQVISETPSGTGVDFFPRKTDSGIYCIWPGLVLVRTKGTGINCFPRII